MKRLAAVSAVSVVNLELRVVVVMPVVVTPEMEALDPQSPSGPTVMLGLPLPVIGPLLPQPPTIELLPPIDQAEEVANAKIAAVSNRLERLPPLHWTRRLTICPSAACTSPCETMLNVPPELTVNGLVEVPTMNRCVQVPDESVCSTTVEAVEGAVPVEVGQLSRVVTVVPLSFFSHRRLLIRPISQLRPASAAANAPDRSRSERASA